MWINIKSNVTRAAIAATALSLTACGGGGGTSLTQAQAPSITLSATSQNMPVQSNGYVYPDQSGLYNSRLIATVRDNQGNPVPSGTVTFTVQGGQTSVGSLFESDFKTTVTVTNPDGTTSTHPAAFWGLPVDVSGSMAQCIFQAGTKTGTATVVATYTDSNGKSAQAVLPIQVSAANNTGLPSSFVAQVNGLPIYVNGQNKNTQAVINAYLYDPSNQPVGSTGANNVQASIVGSTLGGAYLIGSGGQSGSTVVTQSQGSSGLAALTLVSGSQSGTLNIALTADGADNNVDNGIQKPITKTVTVAISDGRVASLSFGGPYANAVKNNQSTLAIGTGDNIDQGTYSRSISVVATDANGNPVPNATIRFGLIDSPLSAGSYPSVDFSPQPPVVTNTSTSFAIQGSKGNPVEGGNSFSESDGVNLLTAGVRPLDRLILTPSEQGTQRDMLGSRMISALTSNSSVSTTTNFVMPATPGYVEGFNIPWVIGRAQYGNIGTTAVTDSNGVANTFVTYPVSRLNQPIILTAEADNGISSVFNAYYVGVAGGTLTSSVTTIPAGTTTAVTMCAYDANQVPLANSTITAGLTNGATTNGSLTTGSNGCASFSIDTTKVPTGTQQFEIPFSIGTGTNETASITVQPAGAPVITLGIGGPGSGSRTITATITDQSGKPIATQNVVFSFNATDDGTGTPAAITSANPVSVPNTNGTVSTTVTYAGNPADSTATPPATGDTYSVTATIGATSVTQTFPY